MSFLVTGAKFHFLEIISNATVIFFKEKICSDYSKRDTHINPQAPGEGEISLPHRRAIFRKLKNEDKDLFFF